tara:strand:+ start:337 stop:507 length:171 start_codon:yes stop_codon:yes gene_type:complete
MERKSYSVRYRDYESKHHEFRTFANDSFDAKQIAMENIKYLNDHPHAIDNISIKIQ